MRIRLCTALLLLISCTAPTRSSDGPDLCSGLVTDKRVRPVSDMPRPSPLTPVVDPAFGSRIIRITEAAEREVIKPMYSTIQAWNADESLMILWNRKKGHQLYDGRTYASLGVLPLESPTDIEQVYWDPLDPDVLYYPSNYQARPRLMRYRVSRKKSELVRDFGGDPTNCPQNWDALLSTGSDPMDMSWGAERIIGLVCGETKFLYSIADDAVLARKKAPYPLAPAPSYDGALSFFAGSVLDANLEVVRKLDLAKAYEHASLGRGAAGPLYGAVDFDGSPAGTLVVHELSTGRKHPIISESNGWPYPPPGTHVSGLARSGPAGWFAVSVVGDPSGSCLLCGELLLANADSGRVCRVAHHRSWAGEGRWGYFAEPHVVLSPSGTRLLFGSDWGNGTSVDTYVVELPAYQGPR